MGVAVSEPSTCTPHFAKTRGPRQGLVPRPRLLSRLDESRDARLFLIQAPAGYGKSSLLQQWAAYLGAAGSGVAWLSLDAWADEPAPFARRLLRALQDAGLDSDPRLDKMLDLEGPYSARLVLADAANRLAGRLSPVYLFLDDVHLIKVTEAFACIQTLLEATSAHFKLVIATREGLDLPLDRFRVLGEMIELKADDLRFTPTETMSFFRNEGHADLDNETFVLGQERTEGWAVGLKLFSMALRADEGTAEVVRAFSGELRHVADYFVEDVLSRQPPALSTFLMRTSVLERLTPAVCDYALEIDNSADLIDQCEGAGLFLEAVDEGRTAFRFHHLFAEYLRRALADSSPALLRQLCRRASEWHFQHGREIEAFELALSADDPVGAARILDASSDALWSVGGQATIERLAARIPAHVMALFPRIMLTLAWRLTAQWRLDEAHQLVSVSKTRLDQLAQDGADPVFLRRQRWLALHRESHIAQARYDLATLEAHTVALIQDADAIGDPYLLGSCYNALQYAQREQFKLGKIEKLQLLAGEYKAKAGSSHGQIFAAATSGPSYLLLGQTDRAVSVLSHGLAIAKQWGGPDAPIGSMVGLPLARVHYERNELSRAQELLDKHLAAATNAGFVDQLLAGWVTQSRLLRLRGDWAGAQGALEEAVEFADRHDLNRLRAVATAEHVRLLLRCGKPDEAGRLARRRGIQVQPSSAAVRCRFTTQDSAVAQAWCRLAATRDRIGDALAVARQWRSFVTTAQATQAMTEWEITLAELLLVSGDLGGAKRALRQAIACAASGRLVRAFLDEGEPIAFLLRLLAKERPDSDVEVRQFLEVLLAGADRESLAVEGSVPADAEEEEATAIMGQMNGREIQILALAGSGLLNRQIGEKLGLTEGTVKWYLQQAFDKVGIRDRVLAAEKAKRLGLTP